MEMQWRHCKQSSNRLQISKGVIGTAGEAGKSRTGTKNEGLKDAYAMKKQKARKTLWNKLSKR